MKTTLRIGGFAILMLLLTAGLLVFQPTLTGGIQLDDVDLTLYGLFLLIEIGAIVVCLIIMLTIGLVKLKKWALSSNRYRPVPRW